MMGDPEEKELATNWACCLLEDIPATCCDAFYLDFSILWPVPTDDPFVTPNSLCKSSKDSCGTSDGLDNCFQKRVRGGSSCASSSSKACREKLRRDHVNERHANIAIIMHHLYKLT
ncbi:uncharacterized protein LOC141642640 [Silene latifolia]|uniref:uncharacterized protein LOC141642640 n=1 Tax=Silene latifolia TaxID=37657 RepID=UPI003D78232E